MKDEINKPSGSGSVEQDQSKGGSLEAEGDDFSLEQFIPPTPQPNKVYISFDEDETGYSLIIHLREQQVDVKGLIERLLISATGFKESKPDEE